MAAGPVGLLTGLGRRGARVWRAAARHEVAIT